MPPVISRQIPVQLADLLRGDANATIEKAVSLGAAVIDGPDDSPFGRFATLADPTGAMFKIVADNVLVANAVQSPEA